MEIDLSQIAGFEWDVGNLTKSAQKHGVSPDEAEEVFYRKPWITPDSRPQDKETRLAAIGRVETGRWLRVIFTVRKNRIRPISCRPANRKEILAYEKALRERG